MSERVAVYDTDPAMTTYYEVTDDGLVVRDEQPLCYRGHVDTPASDHAMRALRVAGEGLVLERDGTRVRFTPLWALVERWRAEAAGKGLAAYYDWAIEGPR